MVDEHAGILRHSVMPGKRPAAENHHLVELRRITGIEMGLDALA
jgi:hypothetical protein